MNRWGLTVQIYCEKSNNTYHNAIRFHHICLYKLVTGVANMKLWFPAKGNKDLTIAFQQQDLNSPLVHTINSHNTKKMLFQCRACIFCHTRLLLNIAGVYFSLSLSSPKICVKFMKSQTIGRINYSYVVMIVNFWVFKPELYLWVPFHFQNHLGIQLFAMTQSSSLGMKSKCFGATESMIASKYV